MNKKTYLDIFSVSVQVKDYENKILCLVFYYHV